MDTFFSRSWVRSMLLNAPIILILISAWISDRWQALTAPAIAIAVAAVATEVFWLRSSAKRMRVKIRKPSAAGLAPVERSAKVSDKLPSESIPRIPVVSPPHLAEIAAWLVVDGQIKEKSIVPRQVPVSGAALWALTMLPENRGFQKSLPHRPSDLEKWKLMVQGEEAFKVEAGAFEIEHFYGHTNIRILDASRVTVEGKERASRAPPSIKEAPRRTQYH